MFPKLGRDNVWLIPTSAEAPSIYASAGLKNSVMLLCLVWKGIHVVTGVNTVTGVTKLRILYQLLPQTSNMTQQASYTVNMEAQTPFVKII